MSTCNAYKRVGENMIIPCTTNREEIRHEILTKIRQQNYENNNGTVAMTTTTMTYVEGGGGVGDDDDNNNTMDFYSYKVIPLLQ